MADEQSKKGAVLVIGGGIAGITAAVETAEVGYPVYLVEKEPSLGGRVARINQYFPKLCPPTCGMEINFKRIKGNPLITVLTMSEVTGISGKAGAYTVTVTSRPRYVNENCTACGKCAEACQTTIPNPFNYGMDRIKAAYLPHEMAYPTRYVLDPGITKTDDGTRCLEACAYNAVDLNMAPQTFELKVASIVVATGWEPYDADTDRQSRVRQGDERHHQRHDGAAGRGERPDRGAHRPAVGRKRGKEHRFLPMRGSERREPPAFLFRGLLSRHLEAGTLCPRAVSGCRRLRLLHRFARHGTKRGFSREDPGGREGTADQGQDRESDGGPRHART